ncbi:DUF6491 family protein [Novosphingobium sp. 9U]|uniref:DUF6491 family protein n=1 Tax=Novosphingobium sp. 9U TaxID=2653158 RepID=UPI0012EF7B75|nr:DUF6491 family protein [Novosphingobium sp. 9U]VWX52810.1 conserved exported hypothetical protein [Novosphingobium sp. 9U]
MHARSIILAAVAAFGGGAVLSACAATTEPTSVASAGASAGRQCFYRSQVNGFQHVRKQARGSDGVIVSVGANQRYLFETLGPCPDIDWSETIGFDQTGPGQICDGLDVTLVVPSTIGPRRCAVQMIRPITREEAKTL